MKYIIRWNAGGGEDVLIVEADSLVDAEKMAQDAWQEAIQDTGYFDAMEYTDEDWADVQ